MRVYLTPEYNSNALRRVENALRAYAPAGVEEVSDPHEADLVILHVVGRHDRMLAQAEAIKGRGAKYAVIQYCLRGTLAPDTAAWWLLWRQAACTWSYYDLQDWCRVDGTPLNFDFYHAPLGVDSDVFVPNPVAMKDITILSSGGLYLTESVRECHHAARMVSGRCDHLGPELGKSDLLCHSGLDDSQLAALYQRCKYISGLRRTEGFELPAAEGLLCGARPILFDRPHYRDWYHQWGIFIDEGSREEVVTDLIRIFERSYDPVTPDEIRAARELFDWRRIVSVFWEMIT